MVAGATAIAAKPFPFSANDGVREGRRDGGGASATEVVTKSFTSSGGGTLLVTLLYQESNSVFIH